MAQVLTARFALRRATAADHRTVDAAFARFRLDDAAHYQVFLMAQADAFLPVEAALDRANVAQFLPDWVRRRRSQALIADLIDLGISLGPGGRDVQYDSAEAALGAAYVLEGSRLGGRMLARWVSATLPTRFLNSGDPRLWPKLVEVLDATLVSDEQIAAAIEAARAVFARFEVSARRHNKDAYQ